MHIRRWAFDVEMFLMANILNIPYAELSIRWHDVEGSKLNIISDSIQIARDYIAIKLLFLFGLWKVTDTDTIWEQFRPSPAAGNEKAE